MSADSIAFLGYSIAACVARLMRLAIFARHADNLPRDATQRNQIEAEENGAGGGGRVWPHGAAACARIFGDAGRAFDGGVRRESRDGARGRPGIWNQGVCESARSSAASRGCECLCADEASR